MLVTIKISLGLKSIPKKWPLVKRAILISNKLEAQTQFRIGISKKYTVIWPLVKPKYWVLNQVGP